MISFSGVDFLLHCCLSIFLHWKVRSNFMLNHFYFNILIQGSTMWMRNASIRSTLSIKKKTGIFLLTEVLHCIFDSLSYALIDIYCWESILKNLIKEMKVWNFCFEAYFVDSIIQIQNALNKGFVFGNVILLQSVQNLFRVQV